jgi:hypothetical protein
MNSNTAIAKAPGQSQQTVGSAKDTVAPPHPWLDDEPASFEDRTCSHWRHPVKNGWEILASRTMAESA